MTNITTTMGTEELQMPLEKYNRDVGDSAFPKIHTWAESKNHEYTKINRLFKQKEANFKDSLD